MSDHADRTDAAPGRRVERDQESLEDLVAGAFGKRRPEPEAAPVDPADTVLTPPAAAAAPRPAPAPDPPPAPAPAPGREPVEMPRPEDLAEDEPPRRRSIWERLQVSPAVIVASLLAGVTGAAADYWFEELAGFVGELRAAEEAVPAAPVIDMPPTDVAPSDFSAEEAAPAQPSAPASRPAPAGPVPASSAGAPAAGVAPGAEAEEGAPPESGPAAPASRVRLVTWDERQSETVVTFWANGPFLPERVVRVRVEGGAPRELLRLRGIDLPYRLTSIDVGTPELVRIRTGFHPQDRVNELHVVLDLAHPGVEIARTEGTGDALRVHLRPAEQ